MATTEEQKKAILPFLQRADEIGKVEPKVAYYCRLYAIQQGLALETRSAQIDGVLKALLSKLEKEKTTITLGDGDSQYCENFAITVFTRADRVDRAGRADKNTAMTFYAASIFFEILNQFKTLEADLVDMQRYAAWKAADIRKALREGRTPTPGAPGDDLSAEGTASGDMDMPSGSTLPQPQDSSDMPGAPSFGGTASASVPMEDQAGAAPRFRAGSRVLYDSEGIPVKGTVAKSSGVGEGSDYMVALSDRIVTAGEASLAPDLEPGDLALYEPQRGEEAPVNVVSVDAIMWPPSYTVMTEGGIQLTAAHTQLAILQQNSRRQSLDQPAFQPSATAAPGSASHSNYDANSIHAPPPAPLPPGSLPTSKSSNEGEAQARPGRSDMSQGLLFNTAGLEHNLAAAQRGDAVDLTEVEELDTVRWADTAAPDTSSVPTKNASNIFASGPPPTPSQVQPPPPPSQAAPVQKAAPQLTGTFTIPQVTAGYKPSRTAISEAQKLAKYAASSLGFEDSDTAIKQLTGALTLLTQSGSVSRQR